MALPAITGEFGIVSDPEIRFTEKGRAWVKVRGVAKDRVRDATGQWSDGDPLFIDIIINSQAENLYESIAKGDSIVVTGTLKQREYEVDGQKRTSIQINADNVGVSVRWGHAKTQRAAASVQTPMQVADELGATLAPF